MNNMVHFGQLKARLQGDSFRVEKVKPDPLNLLVNTDVGSNSHLFTDERLFCVFFLHEKEPFLQAYVHPTRRT